MGIRYRMVAQQLFLLRDLFRARELRLESVYIDRASIPHETTKIGWRRQVLTGTISNAQVGKIQEMFTE